jgi:hypothetical protein
MIINGSPQQARETAVKRRLTAAGAIRGSAVVAVASVAGVAGWVSFVHALEMVRQAGEAGPVALAYPVTIDGLVYSGSMVLLDRARRGERAPRLAWWLLAAGIGATLFANVTAGLRFGALGAVVAAWPALALIGSYELLLILIRGTPDRKPDGKAAPDRNPVPAASNGHPAAVHAFDDYLRRGEVPGIRVIKSRLSVAQPKATQVREQIREVLASTSR